MSSGSSQSTASDSGPNSGLSQYLDLFGAFKRKKMQQIGLVWKNRDCLVAVRKKKPFKLKQLKALRGLLPEKAQRGARRSQGILVASSKTNIQLLFRENAEVPEKRALIKAIKRQSGIRVKVEFITYKDDPREALESLKNGGKVKATT